jgi:hypothetical protein
MPVAIPTNFDEETVRLALRNMSGKLKPGPAGGADSRLNT